MRFEASLLPERAFNAFTEYGFSLHNCWHSMISGFSLHCTQLCSSFTLSRALYISLTLFFSLFLTVEEYVQNKSRGSPALSHKSPATVPMGKIQLQEFNIRINGNKTVYRNGEQIDGICVIVFNGQLDLKSIRIRLIGAADVKWTKTKWVTSSNDRQSRTLTYIQNNTFLEQAFDATQSCESFANTLNFWIVLLALIPCDQSA